MAHTSWKGEEMNKSEIKVIINADCNTFSGCSVIYHNDNKDEALKALSDTFNLIAPFYDIGHPAKLSKTTDPRILRFAEDMLPFSKKTTWPTANALSFISGKIEDAMKCDSRENINILLRGALDHIEAIKPEKK